MPKLKWDIRNKGRAWNDEVWQRYELIPHT